MNRLITILLLLCATLAKGHAQEVVPPKGDEPEFNWVIATIGGAEYNSLNAAFEAVKADNTEIQLKNGTTVNTDIPTNYSTTLDLNGLPLVFTTDAAITIAEGKTLKLTDSQSKYIRHEGSLKLGGKGNLFAGQEVNLAGVGVLDAAATATNLYRVLVTLPDAGGKIDNLTYGRAPVTRLARQGATLCCWLPQSQAARSLQFSYTLNGETTNGSYATDPVTVITHANEAVASEKQNGGGDVTYVAKVGSTQYETLAAALAAVKTSGGIVELTANATIGDVAQPEKAVTLRLNGNTLSTAGTAGLEPAANGSLIVENGSGSGRVTGTLSVNDRCHIRGEVSLTAAILKEGKQMYRVRIALPDAAATATNRTYSYADNNRVSLSVLTEKDQALQDKPVAYLWIPAHTAAAFNLIFTDKDGNEQSLTRYDVAIQSHHDNRILLTQGDTEAILYDSPTDIDNPDKGTPYETFHAALNAAGSMDGSLIRLTRDVRFSGETAHPHIISGGIHVDLHLDGHVMTATNCTLDASASGACLVISDPTGRGRIEGNFRILGNVHIGKEIAAGSIGNVSRGDGNETLLYRVLALVKTDQGLTNGIVYSQWDNGNKQACYLRDKTVCVWSPIGTQPATLRIEVAGETYTANALQVIASHGNTVTVKQPDIVATVDGKGFTSLPDAWAAAQKAIRSIPTATGTISLEENVALNEPLTVAAGNHLVLNLGNHTLTTQDKAALLTVGDGTLVVSSSIGQGALSGNVEVTDGVTVSAKVSVAGLVRLGGATVYRARLLLPAGTTAASYTYDNQSGTLRLIGETIPEGQAGAQVVGYAWMRVANGSHDLVATVTRSAPDQVMTLTNVTVQATHNNQFDMEAGDDVASVDGIYYPTLRSAIEALNSKGAGGTVTLAKPVTLQDKIQVNVPITLNLGGNDLATVPGAHLSVADNASLRIADNGGNTAKGIVNGDLLINGDLTISREVRLTATIVQKGRVVYRLRIEGLPDSETNASYEYLTSGQTGQLDYQDGTAYLWTEAIDREEDLRMTINNAPYTVLIRPAAPGHDTALKAYPYRKVEGSVTWADAANEDTDVEVIPGATLTLQAGCGLKTLRRVTLGEGAQIVATDNILATEGIRYRKTFGKADTWQTLSLPFEPRSVTTEENRLTVNLSPNLASGTGGHYWLRSLKEGDGLVHVDETRIVANKAYIIAVPEELSRDGGGNAVTFTSAGNQFLNRKALAAVLPAGKRMDLIATGTLREMELTLPFYRLTAEGDRFVQEIPTEGNPGKLPPFSCYLLVEPELAATQSFFRLAGLATANEGITDMDGTTGVRLSARKGVLITETAHPTDLVVHDTAGRIVRQRSLSAGTTLLPLSTGNYIINQTIIHIP